MNDGFKKALVDGKLVVRIEGSIEDSTILRLAEELKYVRDAECKAVIIDLRMMRASEKTRVFFEVVKARKVSRHKSLAILMPDWVIDKRSGRPFVDFASHGLVVVPCLQEACRVFGLDYLSVKHLEEAQVAPAAEDTPVQQDEPRPSWFSVIVDSLNMLTGTEDTDDPEVQKNTASKERTQKSPSSERPRPNDSPSNAEVSMESEGRCGITEHIMRGFDYLTSFFRR